MPCFPSYSHCISGEGSVHLWSAFVERVDPRQEMNSCGCDGSCIIEIIIFYSFPLFIGSGVSRVNTGTVVSQKQ